MFDDSTFQSASSGQSRRVAGKYDDDENLASLIQNAIPTSVSNISVTRFPHLDICHHNYSAAADDGSFRHSLKRQGLPYDTARQSVEVDDTDSNAPTTCLRRYAAFVLDLIGEDECSILCRITDTSGSDWKGYVHACTEESSNQRRGNSPVKIQALHVEDSSALESLSDFAFEYKQRDTNKDIPTLHGENSILTLHVEHIDSSFATSVSYSSQNIQKIAVSPLLRVLSSYLYDSCTLPDDDISTLNYPPRGPKKDSVASALLHSAFFSQAAEHPGRDALEYLNGDGTSCLLKYEDLRARSEALAQSLFLRLRERPRQANGLNLVIPIYISTSPELYIAYLATLTAGYAFCPLPLDAPAERLRGIVEDIKPSIILGVGVEPSSGPLFDAQILSKIEWIDIESSSILANHRDAVDEPSLSDLAYVMYTSGTTGKPKGVQITHGAAWSSIMAHIEAKPLQVTERAIPRWFQFAAPTFDPSVMEIFVTLSSGATLCAAPRELTLSDPEKVVSKLEASVMMATPSVASLIRPEKVPHLQQIWTMGEPLTRRVIEHFASNVDTTPYGDAHVNGNGMREPSIKSLTNAYGPTEAAINCTMLPDVLQDTRGSIIGSPLSTCSMLVLNPHTPDARAMPLGFSGELAIGGPQLSIGYLNRPDADSAAFVTHPLYGRVYRTGDRARVVWDHRGIQNIEFLGRLSEDQVKINGQRVELGEVDSILDSINGIVESATILHRRDAQSYGGEELVACVVAERGSQGNKKWLESTCRELLSTKLPVYMQPSRFLFLDRLPRSSSAKLDRRRLAATVASLGKNPGAQVNGELRSSSSYVPNGVIRSSDDGLIEVITSEMCNVAKDNTITYESRLYVDSLTSMRLLQRLRDRGFSELSLKDLLHAKTTAQVAHVVRKRRKSGTHGHSAHDLPPIHELNDVDTFSVNWKQECEKQLGASDDGEIEVLPVTTTQARLLLSFTSRRSPDDLPRYVNQSIFCLKPRTNIGRLREAWEIVLSRHEIFRSQFVPVDDDLSPFAQCVWKSRRVPCGTATLPATIHDNDAIDKGISVIAKGVHSRIGLTNTCNVTIVESSKDNYFVLTLMHAIFDYGSLQLILQEVNSEYLGKVRPQRVELRHAINDHFIKTSNKADNFWTEYLEGASPPSFPCLTGLRQEMVEGSTKTTNYTSAVTVQRLEDKARQLKCSPLALVQLAWSSILLAYTGAQTDEAIFGTIHANRSEQGTENCMAPTFCIVPTRLKVDPANGSSPVSASCLLEELTYHNAEAQDHLHPRIGSKHGRKALYDTTLALQIFSPRDDGDTIWKEAKYLPMAHDSTVMMEIWPDRSGLLVLQATYTDEHLDDASALLMNEQMAKALEWIFDHAEERYTNILGGIDRNISSRSNPRPNLPKDHMSQYPFIHSQFEYFAKTIPDSQALVFVNDTLNANTNVEWTYRQLNDKADALASLLLDQLGPLHGNIIPILIEKSPELYIAVLGIVKAGGAWCPIDTASPPARRRELIFRVDARLLLVGQEDEVDLEGIPDDVKVVNLRKVDLQASRDSEQPIPPVSSLTCSSNAAYLIWTSGTTGLPKGVPVSHNSATTSMHALHEIVPGTSSTRSSPRCTQFSQHTFDVFVQDLFYTWGLGGTVVSATKEIMVGSFPDFVKFTGATHAHLTPAFASGVERKLCPSLEIITMIGEKLPQHVADDWGEEMIAFNTYGPAEATVVSTLARFKGKSEKVKSSNVGFPLPSVSCYVVRDNSVVMIHGVGELALGGHQLASGYYKDPDKTTDKFRQIDGVDEKVYMTGDIVRLLANGTIEFIGREDDLVKLGGIRVELSEISFALRGCHPRARQIETFQMGRSDRASKLVVSFIAAGSVEGSDNSILVEGETAKDIAAAALQQGRRNLPDFMIPGLIITVEAIPKTPSAKVDRKKLQAIFEAFAIDNWESGVGLSSEAKHEFSEGDKSILEVVSALSGVPVESMNPSSYLPTLGIDSLNAGRLVSRLRNAGILIHISNVLKSRTIADLLSTIPDAGSRSPAKKTNFDTAMFNQAWRGPVKDTVNIGDTFTVIPASRLQDGLLGESLTNSSSYWSNHVYKLADNVDLRKLQSAWQELSDRTEALRTSFLSIGQIAQGARPMSCHSAFLQVIHAQQAVDWSQIKPSTESLADSINARFLSISEAHSSNSYAQTPWAVSIFKEGSSRYMALTIHHALHDALSLEYILLDLGLSYRGQLSAEARRPQLTDCMAAILDMNEASRDAFWTDVLSGFSGEASSWPDLTGKPETKETQREKKLLTIKMDLSSTENNLRRISMSFGGTPASVIRAALGVLILDYFEASSVVFGEIYSHRAYNSDLEDAIAPLIATAPMPLRLTDTVKQLLVEQEELMSKIRARPAVSGTLVREQLKKPMSEPLYPAVFVFHPQDEHSGINLERSEWQPVEDPVGLKVEHPFALNVYQGDKYSLELIAEDTFITSEHLSIIGHQIDALVAAMVRDIDAPLKGLLNNSSRQVLSIAESRLPWPDNHECTLYPPYWLEHNAAEHPDWIAVEVAEQIVESSTDTRSWTYQTLDKESNRMAAFIADQGHYHKVIAMCAGRTLKSYACIVGILKSGNTYLPVDDGLPQDRKLLYLEDSECPLLFTDEKCLTLVPSPPPDCTVINLDVPAVSEKIQSMPTVFEKSHPGPLDNAYLLYTSGSTGKPKGVLVGHAALCGFVEGFSDRFHEASSGVTHSKAGVGKWLGLASRAFDVHLGEMFLAWRLGLTAITAPRETLLDDLGLALTELKVTHTIIVPSLLESAGLEPSDVPDLVYLAVGGEKLSRHIIDKWVTHPSLTVVNAYGPTELAIGCTASHVVPSSIVRNIGRPYSNSVARVLVPGTTDYAKRGQSGELCFTGCLVGNGYLNRPDAKGFIEDFNGQRMYRTGDMVRMMADDKIEYLGRSDDQTKIRGQRIELSEVSETIRKACNFELDVATLVLSHPSMSASQLITFVAEPAERDARYGAEPKMVDDNGKGAELQAFCREQLSPYMVPDHVIQIDILPMAQIAGKTDAKILKAFFASLDISRLLDSSSSVDQAERSEEPARDLTSDEEFVKRCVLNVMQIQESHLSHNANLLRLGFSSLDFVGLSVQLRGLGYDARVSALLTNPTLEGIAKIQKTPAKSRPKTLRALVDEETQRRALGALSNSTQRDNVENILPCLPLQESLVATTMNSNDVASYVNHMIFDLDVSVEQNHFKRALEALVEKAPILRTSFLLLEDQMLQVVHKPGSLKTHWSASSCQDAETARKSLHNSQKDVSSRIVKDIEQMPPWRCHFVKCEGGPSPFMLSIHHSLYDGNSLDMMLDDLYRFYHNEEVPPRTALAELLRELSHHDREAQEKFWTEYLANYSSSFASKRTDDGVTEHSLSLPVSAKLDGVQAAAQKSQVTPASLLETVFGAIMARTVQTNDFVFGTILSGRSVPVEGADTIIGPCITTIPQRISFRSSPIYLDEVAVQVQNSIGECLEHQHTSLRLMQRLTATDSPLFDCLYSFDSSKGSAPLYEKLMLQTESAMTLDYPFALEFAADEATNSLTAKCTYSSNFGDSDKVRDLVEQMNLLISALCRGEKIKVSDLGIVDAEDTTQGTESASWSEVDWSQEENLVKSTIASITGVEASAITKSVSFFRLGVDSISAIRLAKALRKAGFKALSSDIMRYACIGELCARVGSQSKKPDQPSGNHTDSLNLSLTRDQIPSLKGDTNIDTLYPCTPLQTGMIVGTIASTGKLYVHHHAILLKNHVDLAQLEIAWNKVVMTFDIFRTSFHYVEETGNSWVAAVHTDMPVAINHSLEEHYFEYAEQYLRLPDEDSFVTPPIKASIKMSDKGRLFILTMHHALYDGNSVPMIFERLAHAYKSQSVDAVPFSVAADVIARQQKELVDFWLETLKGFQPPETGETFSEGSSVKTIEKTLQLKDINLEEACKSLDITLQTVTLAAFTKALACLLGQRDVVFGHVVAGRSLPVDGADEIIGPMFNTVPFRLRLENTLQSNLDAALQVQNFTAQSQDHQHAPLQQIQNSWRQNQNNPSTRLFDALFLFQKRPTDENVSNNLWSPYNWDAGIASSDYKLNFEVEQGENCLIISASYQEDSISEEQLQETLSWFEGSVQDILSQPSRSALASPQPLSNLPLSQAPKEAKQGTNDADEQGAEIDLVRRILSEVSGIPEASISSNTNIFALGLDSISSIKVASKCRNAGLSLGVGQILQGATAYGISRLAQSKPGVTISTSSSSRPIKYEDLQGVPIAEDQVECIIPCLAGQAYHLSSWLQSGRTFGEPTWVFKSGKLDRPRLEKAWRALCERHTILRTTFTMDKTGEPVQVVLKSSANNFSHIKSELDVKAMKEHVRSEQNHASDLSQPPVRLTLVQNSVDEATDAILLTINHALYDAFSLPILLSDFSRLYSGTQLLSPVSFSETVSQITSSLNPIAESSYWTSALGGLQPTLLASSRADKEFSSRSSLPSQDFISVPDTINNIPHLKTLAQKRQLGLPSVILLAFARTISRATKIDSPTFGYYQAGRSLGHNVAGPCLNMTPLLVRNASAQGTKEAVMRIQSDLVERVPFEQSAFPKILEYVGMKDQVVFNTYVNLLWHQDKMSVRASRDEGEVGSGGRNDSMFEKMDVGLPSDFARSEVFEGKTPIDGLKWPLAREGFYVDIALSSDGKSVNVGARVEGGIVEKEEMKNMLEGIGTEVEAIMNDLGA